MLKPEANKARTVLSLPSVWDFQLAGETFDSAWVRHPLPDPTPMAVPGSYNSQKATAAYRDHYGWAVYQTRLTVPSAFLTQRVWLRFGGVTHRAQVFLNGELLGEHRGGFLPFEFELTARLPLPEGALLTVAVDNRIDFTTLPVGTSPAEAQAAYQPSGVPSIDVAEARRAPFNRPNFDFFNFAGIHRPVCLYTTPQTYIQDVAVTPSLDGTTGLLRYSVTTSGATAVSVTVQDQAGVICAKATGPNGVLRLQNAHLWAPGKPYLYQVTVTAAADRYQLAVGVRTVQVSGTKLLINGEPFYFKGFGKHEDAAVHGRGEDDCQNVLDVDLIHWLNANSFRTSHYPYAEEMYDLCDRAGIVIIDEVPAVGLGWGQDGRAYRDPAIYANHAKTLQDMIARDKNHPSVVMWSLANEAALDQHPTLARDYFHRLYELAHVSDPASRPVTGVSYPNDYQKDLTTRTMDVVCLNRYYGWYNLSGDLDAACDALAVELDWWAAQHKPVMLTEYGADTIAGLHNVVPGMFDEEFQVAYYRRLNAVLDRYPFVIGEQAWNFADFATIQGTLRVDGNKKGLFTRDRRPKMAAHYFKDRWAAVPDFGYKR
ncbi:beta-glucuronidase [Lacticaseibacillus parakribbianus]|uniref:beta-glucuronidase n=1 Tax=Lacticaseibacillus parakribbianus TaxID=2970927 RepID=UPI0021CB3A8C|nr:beta-glucuronidase [Lacticaseibacillus parakribbianus]